MLYEVIVRSDTTPPGSPVFRTVVEADSADAAGVEGLHAMRRELVGPLTGPKLIVEITAMEEKPA